LLAMVVNDNAGCLSIRVALQPIREQARSYRDSESVEIQVRAPPTSAQTPSAPTYRVLQMFFPPLSPSNPTTLTRSPTHFGRNLLPAIGADRISFAYENIYH